jgi:phosphate transport system substrate-binding protein
MATHFRYLLFVVIYIITGCAPRTTNEQSEDERATPGNYNLSGEITISGAYALAPLARSLAEGYSQKNPGVKFGIETTGTGTGLDAITNGAIHLAMVSRPLTDEERSAGFFPVPIAKDAVVLIINRENPYIQSILERGLDPRILAQVFTGEEQMTWGDLMETSVSDKVNLYTRSDVSGAASLWASFLYSKQSDLKGTPVEGDAEMIQRVQNDKFALGYCNLTYAYDNVTRQRKENIQVVPIDLKYNKKISTADQPYETLEKIHRAIYLGIYPHELCRKLCLVSEGRPTDPLLLDFLRWTLTEGQAVVSPTGYCEFNNAEKKVALEIIQ